MVCSPQKRNKIVSENGPSARNTLDQFLECAIYFLPKSEEWTFRRLTELSFRTKTNTLRHGQSVISLLARFNNCSLIATGNSARQGVRTYRRANPKPALFVRICRMPDGITQCNLTGIYSRCSSMAPSTGRLPNAPRTRVLERLYRRGAEAASPEWRVRAKREAAGGRLGESKTCRKSGWVTPGKKRRSAWKQQSFSLDFPRRTAHADSLNRPLSALSLLLFY